MGPKHWKHTSRGLLIGWTLLLVGALGSCAGVVFGGEFPLTAAMWAVLLWPLALGTLVAWVVVVTRRPRDVEPRRGFEVLAPHPSADAAAATASAPTRAADGDSDGAP